MVGSGFRVQVLGLRAWGRAMTVFMCFYTRYQSRDERRFLILIRFVGASILQSRVDCLNLKVQGLSVSV